METRRFIGAGAVAPCLAGLLAPGDASRAGRVHEIDGEPDSHCR